MPKSEGGLGFRGIVINCRGCKHIKSLTAWAQGPDRFLLGANVPVTSPQVIQCTDNCMVARIDINYPLSSTAVLRQTICDAVSSIFHINTLMRP